MPTSWALRTSRGEAGDRLDLVHRQRLLAEQTALELQDVRRAREVVDRLGRHGGVAADEGQGGGALEQLVEPGRAGLLGGAQGEAVLDHPERRVGVAQLVAQLGDLGDRDPAVVDGEDGVGALELVGDLLYDCGLLFLVHVVSKTGVETT
jgi:hypothetical protein